MSVLGLIMSISPYLRSAMVRFPLANADRADEGDKGGWGNADNGWKRGEGAWGNADNG